MRKKKALQPLRIDEDKQTSDVSQISRADALQAVRVLLTWIGENPDREGLKETPRRVVDAFKEYFSGYDIEPESVLSTTFNEIKGYSEMVLLKSIPFTSHCEHHIQPFTGVAHVAYMPDKKIVGISKLARVVDCFAKRLQTQEVLTIEILECIQRVLEPKGCAVYLCARHQCMQSRGVKKNGSDLITSAFSGVFDKDSALQLRFLQSVESSS